MYKFMHRLSCLSSEVRYTVMQLTWFCCQFDGSTLYITDARPKDRGLYLCEVENSAGQSYASVVIEVESEFARFI